MLVVKCASLNANDLAFKGDKFPALFLLHLRDLLFIIEELNVRFGTSKLSQRRDDCRKVGKEILPKNSAHPTPAVEEI
jgi:hypothetical protein